MAESGVPYSTPSYPGGATTPDLRDPLGPPKIVSGPGYMDSLARLGYNVENMSSPLPTMTKIAQGMTSLVDNQYNQALAYKQAQANIDKTVADTSYYQAHADNIDQLTDQAKQMEPLKVQQERQLVQQNKYALDHVQRAADNTDKAWDEYGGWSAAVAKLDPNSNTYDDDLYNLNKHPNASANPDTMRTIKPLIDQQNQLRSMSSTHALSLAQQKELQVYQDNGLIPSDVDLRGQINQGNGQTLIAQAKRDASLQRLKTVQNLGTPQEQMWAQQQMDEITGRNYVGGDQPPPMFAPNGDLNTGTELNLRKAEANLQARFGVVSPYAGMTKEVQRQTVTGGKAGEKPQTTVTETYKGAPVTPGEEQRAAQPPAQPNLQPQGVPNTPENNVDKAAYQRGEISYEELNRRVYSRMAAGASRPGAAVPSPVPAPTPSPSPPVEGVSQADTSSQNVPAPEPKVDIASSGYSKGRGGQQPQYIVIHSSDGNEKSDIETLTQGNVSAHYYTTKDGQSLHFVPEEDTAWHAGKTAYPSISNANTIGIEQEHIDGKEPWSDAEVQATARTVAGIMRRNPNITLDHVVGHSDIAPERKQDPLNYPWDKFRKYVQADLGQQPSTPRVSPDQLEQHFGGRLAGHANDFIEAGRQYNLNPALLASIAIEESGNGTNDATIARNNPMSMGGGGARYDSIRDGIFAAARDLRENYVNQGLKDVASIGRKYAPPGAPNDRGTNKLWPSDVTSIYKRVTS
jgi:N-acetyl-anhydromuramyl-L-alanine amidase AmpD